MLNTVIHVTHSQFTYLLDALWLHFQVPTAIIDFSIRTSDDLLYQVVNIVDEHCTVLCFSIFVIELDARLPLDHKRPVDVVNVGFKYTFYLRHP